MPIYTATPVSIASPTLPFARLAFRGSLQATISAGAVSSGNLNLHITTYRKVDAEDGSSEIETAGTRNGTRGASINYGGDAADTALIARIAEGAAGAVLAAPGNAEVQVNFGWGVKNGDIVGMVQATITPSEGDAIEVACGDVANWNAAHPSFALAYGAALSAIGDWIAVKGW